MIHYDVREQVAEILFDNPPVNALSEQMLDDYLDALHRAARDPAVRAVIVGSAVPGRFCAGLNLAAIHSGDHARVRALLERLYVRNTDAQFGMGKPTIAAIDGTARGGGMTLAISCDLIVAGEGATFGYPEIDAGVPPSIHFTHLPRIVGRHRAFELLFTGRSFDTQEACRLGLVSRVAPAGEALAQARELARTLCGKSAEVIRHGRAAFMHANDNGYRAAVAAAADSFCQAATLDSAREGIAAFVEKRKPVWPQPE
ncbi:enoyl-CoA hydratase/isomerase family protein [Bordetella sp. 2513F-2]